MKRSFVTKAELWKGAKEGFEKEFRNRPMDKERRNVSWLGYLFGYAHGLHDANAISNELLASVEQYTIKQAEGAECAR